MCSWSGMETRVRVEGGRECGEEREIVWNKEME